MELSNRNYLITLSYIKDTTDQIPNWVFTFWQLVSPFFGSLLFIRSSKQKTTHNRIF